MESAVNFKVVGDAPCALRDVPCSGHLPRPTPKLTAPTWNYRTVLEKYLRHAHWIKVNDPFFRNTRQADSFLLLAALVEKPSECRMHLVTRRDQLGESAVQMQLLESVQTKLAAIGIAFTFEISECVAERSIVTERWELRLNQGLDLFRIENGSLQKRRDPIDIRPRF